jgi:hypothetical protein
MGNTKLILPSCIFFYCVWLGVLFCCLPANPGVLFFIGLYKKSCTVHELMQQYIHRYFVTHLALDEDAALLLHQQYFKEYGLPIEGLVPHHQVIQRHTSPLSTTPIHFRKVQNTSYNRTAKNKSGSKPLFEKALILARYASLESVHEHGENTDFGF